MQVVPLKKGSKSRRMRVLFDLVEQTYPPIQSFEVIGSDCLPADISKRVMERIRPIQGDSAKLGTLNVVRDTIESYYTERGFNYSSMREFEGLETGRVRVRVFEPRVRNVNVKLVDDHMKEIPPAGAITKETVLQVMEIRSGQFYSADDGRRALQEAFNLGVRSS